MFIDVLPSHWFFKDVVELNNLEMYGFGKFIESIPYNIFETGYPLFDRVYKISNSTDLLNLNVLLTNSSENPIRTFLNGTEIGYREITTSTDNKTIILFTRVLSSGDYVRVIQQGKPLMDVNSALNKPVSTDGVYELPFAVLSRIPQGYSYVYDANNLRYYEIVTHKGVQLKRVPAFLDKEQINHLNKQGEYVYIAKKIPNKQEKNFYTWDSVNSVWSEEKIPKNNLMYSIFKDPGDNKFKIVVPFKLNNEILNIRYMIAKLSNDNEIMPSTIKTVQEIVVPQSNDMVYVDRFFPDTYVSRIQLLAFLDRLRVYLLLNYANYKNYSEVVNNKPITQSVFIDVRSYPETVWWWKHLMTLEDLKLINGEYLLNYDSNGNPIVNGGQRPSSAVLNVSQEVPITREEAAWLINRFRKYYIDWLF